MSIRPVKRIVAVEAAPSKAPASSCTAPSASATPASSIRSCCSTTSATTVPTTTWPASRGIRTAASRPSPTCWPARSSTATASATAARSAPGDVQWMTAGSGILHQEMPQGDRAGPHARLPALGQPAVVAQDDRAALPGRPGEGDPRDHRRRRHAGARDHAATSGARGARSKASPPIRATSTSRCRRASARRLTVETNRHAFAYVFEGSGTFSRRVGAVRRARPRRRRRRARRSCASRPATARWCCSTAATR